MAGNGNWDEYYKEHSPRLGQATIVTLLLLPTPIALIFGAADNIRTFLFIWVISFFIAIPYMVGGITIYQMIASRTRPTLIHALGTGFLFGITNQYIPLLNMASALGTTLATIHGLVGAALFWTIAQRHNS